MQACNKDGIPSMARGLQICHCEEAVGRRGNLGKALPDPYRPPLKRCWPPDLSLRGGRRPTWQSRSTRPDRGKAIGEIATASPRFPRRFAPRNDKPGSIARSAKPLYNLPACKALTGRRYRRNWLVRFYRQPMQIVSAAPGPAVRSPTMAHIKITGCRKSSRYIGSTAQFSESIRREIFCRAKV